MKNIHLIPTDKPSRLQLNVNTKRLILFNNIQSNNESAHLTTQNIYITSDEEIKEDEYYLGQDNNIYCLVTTVNFNGKKIILTTDQDLINDGVQAINDKFLEWFVKNPGCEEVNVENEEYILQYLFKPQEYKFRYKIIIPIEEPKQTDENGKPLTYWGGLAEHKQETLEEEPKQEITLEEVFNEEKVKGVKELIDKHKQETLEEAAEKHVKINVAKNAAKLMYKEHFIAGAKWQQENSQSIVPYDAYNIEVFNIEADEDGKLFAYIGYKISNGNFHFNVVPFTEPKKEIKLEDVFNEEHYEIKEKLIKEQKPQDKTYTEQEVKYLLEVQRGNCYVALLSHTKNDDIASVALGAPEPGGRNGTWVK